MNALISLFQHITVYDLVDIAFVSIILYRLMLIVRGTRAVQMLIGLLAMTALYWVGVTYNLHTIGWILHHFFESFFVLAVILFQDQIRAALAILGETRIFEKKVSYNERKVIDEVVTATSALSKKKVGALIVFEKLHGLMNYTKTGTALNSEVSSELVFSLFLTTSSLHDGAMIIKNDKIVAAGCFLPLSRGLDLDRQYGTRHRAALGLTEHSDALVVVVSEETGKIAVCFETIFYKVASAEDLKGMLERILSPSDKSKKMIFSRERA